MPTTEVGRRRRLTTEEREAALLELAICAGNSDEARRRLKKQGITVSSARLRQMRLSDHRDRYIELCNTHAKRVEQIITARARENAHDAGAAISEAISKARQQIATGDIDASKAAVQLATAQGIQIDKALLLEGRPTQITEHRDIEDYLRSLNELIPGLVIDGTATDITPVQTQEQIPRSLLDTRTDESNAREAQAA